MTKMEVSAAIYSTAAGALVHYENDDLIREWKRLEKLSPAEFDKRIKPPASRTASPPTQLEFPEL